MSQTDSASPINTIIIKIILHTYLSIESQSFCISPFILFLTMEKACWKSAESRIVPSISLKRHTGITNVSSFFGTRGRADGSSIPRKHLRPPIRFSLTAKEMILEQPEPKGADTASVALLS